MSSDNAGRGKSRADFAGQARHIVPKHAAAVSCDKRDVAGSVRGVLTNAGVLNACASALVVGGTKVRVEISGFIEPDRHFKHDEYFALAGVVDAAVAWTRSVMQTREGLA